MPPHYTTLATALAATLQLAAIAAVPLAWDARPGNPAPASFDRYHGEALEFRCTFRGFGELPFAAGADVRLWYQTNGMGQAWWSAPATIQSNVLSATWSPALDPGADRVSLFFGAPSNAYASAVLRLRHSPGFAPGGMPDPESFRESDPVFAAWLATYTPPNTSLEPATNYTHSALGAFAATGTVARALSYGTPTRWTDATGCVWEVSAAPGTGYADWICSGVPDGYEILGVEPSPNREGEWRLDLYDGDIHGFFTFGGPAAACLVFDVLGAMVEARPKSTNTNLVGRVARTSDLPPTISNVVTKSYVEALGILSEEADPVWIADKPNYAPKAALKSTADLARARHDYRWAARQGVLYRIDFDADGYQYLTPVTNVNALAEGNEHILIHLEEQRHGNAD